MKNTLMFLLITPFLSFGQTPKETAFQSFENLIGGRWAFEGQWPNGQKFKQEYLFEWGLNKQIVKVKTYGTVNMETGEFGLRNEGIRSWDKREEKMRFYDFDVFGGVYIGDYITGPDEAYYEYLYEVNGKMELFRDTWKYVDKNTYEVTVSMKTDEDWQVFTINEVVRKE